MTRTDPTGPIPAMLTAGRGTTVNRDIYAALTRLRASSRDLHQNNEFGKTYVRSVRRNMVGPDGLTLQVNATDDRDPALKDTNDNNLIESEWRKFSKVGNFDVSGRFSGPELARSLSELACVDGEFLLRLHGPESTGGRWNNEWGFAVELIEIERLDETFNLARNRDTDTEIIMSVEVDRFKRPVAYWIRDVPENDINANPGQQVRRRVPASEIIHGYLPFGAYNTRGVPWMHAGILPLHHHGRYREAAVKAARLGAEKVGVWETEGDDPFHEKDENGNLIDESTPTHFDRAPPGSKLSAYNPTYPHEQYKDFNMSTLQGTASAFGVSYFSLSNDHASVNFSSGKLGVHDERDEWQTLQAWLGEILERIYVAWLRSSILVGRLPLPVAKLDKWVDNARFEPRSWVSVQPKEDAETDDIRLDNFSQTYSDVIRKRTRREPEDVWTEMEADLNRVLPLMERLAKVKALEKSLNGEKVPSSDGSNAVN